MKQPRKFKDWLEILLVIAAIILIPLFFAIRSQAGQAANTVSASGTARPPASPATPVVARPTAAPSVANGKEPPPCTFPLAQITTTQSAPANYTFSDPQIALTAPKGNIYHIDQWLPDNQQVLMTEELRNAVLGNNNPLQEFINLYNPETGISKVYALRTLTSEPPSWLPSLNAVVYPTINYTSFDSKNFNFTFTRQVWVSRGDPNAAQKLADNLSQFPLGVKPDGSEIIYRSDNKIFGLDNSLKSIPSISFDPTQWDYAKDRRNNYPVYFNIALQPGTSLIFLYSDGAMGGGGYTFILNTDTGRVCELNFRGWALAAHWSSDGRYLAIIRIPNSHASDLTVLDIQTGKLTSLDVAPQEIAGLHEVNDFVWAPDNRHMLAIGSVFTSLPSQSQSDIHGLYLVDFVSAQSVHIAPKYTSFISSGNNNLAWSPDGSKVVIRCPAPMADQLCFISVQKTEQ